MCGIAAIFKQKADQQDSRQKVLGMAKQLRHRGPDWSGIYEDSKAVIAHERLAIVDPKSGKQPLVSHDGRIVLAVNGEIYNHRKLREECKDYRFKTESDCEVIIPLYQKYGSACIEKLQGMFAFILYDTASKTHLVARDHMGIIPLYYGTDQEGQRYYASELKSLEGICPTIDTFPPGEYYESQSDSMRQWYTTEWTDYTKVKESTHGKEAIKAALMASVESHLMSDVPYGVLLSGGLDSSIISAVAKSFADKRIESDNTEGAWYPQLHSFAIGLEGSPDLAAARKVADHIGSIHHEVHFTIQEGIDALSDVIYHLETYDITTVRASTPMYLLARVIKSMGIKMVLSGEGADEIFGGYLYFHKAPDAKAFHEETVRKLSKLHLYDCLRANKSLSAWGVEGRVPFLDKQFMEVAMSLNPELKMCGDGKIEKHILREAFEDFLPPEVAWRQKEQFSDGVGYSWIDSLKDLVNEKVSESQLAEAAKRFPINTPQTKEEYYYRSIFESHFPSATAANTVPSVPSIACSSPVALEWDASFTNQNEPSGRAIKSIHVEAY